MSNDFQLVRKANRGFEAIADAVLDDVYEEDLYEEDLIVDDEGNVYALVGEIEKADEPKASAGRYATGMAVGPLHGLVAGKKGRKLRAAGNEWTGAALGSGLGMAGAYGVGRQLGKIGNPKARAAAAIAGASIGTAGGLGGSALGIRRAQAMGHYKPQNVEKGMPSVLRQAVRADKKVNAGNIYDKIKRGPELGHTKNQDQTRQMFDRMFSANKNGREQARFVAAARKTPEFSATTLATRGSNVKRATEQAAERGGFNARKTVRAYGSQPGKLESIAPASVARRAKIAERSAALKPGAAGRSALAGETGGTSSAGLQAAGSSSSLADRALAANARAGLSRPAPKKRSFFGR